MAVESSESSENDGFEVEDDEGFVDRQRKKQILENRREVEEAAKQVFPQVKLGNYTEDQAVGVWHEIVRSYLMSIEPLLKDFSLPNAEQAYLYEPLGSVVLKPPEKYQQRQGIKQMAESGVELLSEPLEPTSRTIEGLKTVIEQDTYTETWQVEVNHIKGLQGANTPPQTETVTATEPIPRIALMNAVRTADEFLQNANVGLAVGQANKEAKSDYSQIEDIDSL